MDYKDLYEKTPPTKLFAIVAIPGIISMLMSSLYQVVDGVFVGQLLGSNAFAALNLVMPLVILNFSIADLIGVGSAVQISIKLREKDEEAASNIFSAACH
jgi:Na+-driven multidrug efflux pump